MKLKKLLSILLCCALAAGMLIGCGSGSGTAKDAGNNGAEPTEGTTDEAAKPEDTSSSGKRVTIKLFTGKIETIDLMNEIINEFNSSQDRITVEQEYQKDASNIIKIKFAADEAPDIMTVYEQGYVEEGKYLDLSGQSEWWNRLTPAMKELCADVNSGKQYRVCTNMTMAGMFYNKEIFQELGLKTAATWEEFVSNLETIKAKKPDVTPFFIFGNEAWHLGHLIEFIPHGYLKANLGTVEAKKAMLNNDSAKLKFGDPNGAMAVFAQNLLDLQAKGLINADVLTATSDNCIQDFANGRAAMFSNGMWCLSSILEANPDMADKIGFAPYPAYMEGSQPVVLSAEDSGYSISSTTEHQAEAIEFLDFLFNAENQKKYSESLKAPSAFRDVDAQWASQGMVGEVSTALDRAVNIGFTNEKPAGFTGDDAGRMVQELFAGNYTAAEFAAVYENAWNSGMQ